MVQEAKEQSQRLTTQISEIAAAIVDVQVNALKINQVANLTIKTTFNEKIEIIDVGQLRHKHENSSPGSITN